jgi:MoxR-like ATPase
MKKNRNTGGLNPVSGTDPSWNSILLDFNTLVKLYTEKGVSPDKVVNVRLPSGRVLHNPAKKKVKSPERWASQQISNATAAASDWLDGVKNPSRDPVSAAIDAKDKFVDRLEAAIKAGKWEKRLKKVTHSDIVSIAEKVGEDGFKKGIEAREDKIKKVVGELQPLLQAVSDTIQALPDKTDADREKRLLTARKLMIEVGTKR